MVSGTAWYAVSLANVKKKFEQFGLELTADLVRAFVTSLILLVLIVLVSLNPSIIKASAGLAANHPWLPIVSGLLGTATVIKLVYDIFVGSVKYDINDSMLAGQNESAEKYFRKSLSILNSCAENLKKKDDPMVSNYFIGLAFYEIFSFVTITKGHDEIFQNLLKEAEILKAKPGIPREKAEIISEHLIEQFLTLSTYICDERTKKSYRNIQLELQALRENPEESPAVRNVRISVIFEEMEDMLESHGETLFKKRREYENKYLVKTPPADLEKYPNEEILQGYLKIEGNEELRIRKKGKRFIRTFKKTYPSGYREEIEEYIDEKTFNELWPQTVGKRVEKKRYCLPYKNLIIELDIFTGANQNLIMAEVEFPDEEVAKIFSPPPWFGLDVTNDENYKNKNLAK
jgi:CYTH domain-containing protein